MKKILKFILLFLLVNMIIWGLGLSISYFAVRKNGQIMEVRELYEIPNGHRVDGLVYSTTYCKDGLQKTTFSWQDVKCSRNRIFEDGIYTNELGVKISKEIFDKYLTDEKWFFQDTFEIDKVDQETYNIFVDLYKDDNKVYQYCDLEKRTADNERLYSRTDDRVEFGSKDFKCNLELQYCWIGFAEGKSLFTKYENGHCEAPENICDLLKDKNARIFNPENYYKYCLK